MSRGAKALPEGVASKLIDKTIMDGIAFRHRFMRAGLAHEMGLSEKDVDPKELKAGIEMEMGEHGGTVEIAKKIALDHLAENPRYYSRLAWMESGVG